MKKVYTLCHGFGFGDWYWDNICHELDGDVRYFNPDMSLDNSVQNIAIGHSIGFLKLNNSGLRFDHIIGLQGFLNFCGNGSKMRVVREHNLKQTTDMFIQNDKDVALEQFYKACGIDDTNNRSNTESKQDLLTDLEMMKNNYEYCGISTTILGSPNDFIVPLSLIKDNFRNLPKVKIIEANVSHHALGYKDIDLVLRVLKIFS